MLSIIVALGANNVIGCNGGLVWNIPEDLKRFKKLTTGKKIIMGRKTFQGLPFVLPNRHHIVVTNDINFTYDNPNVEICTNLDDLIENCRKLNEEIFIIGGGTIYKNLINKVDKLYITYIDKEYKGDTFFPIIDENLYKPSWKSDTLYSDTEQCNFYYVNYERI